MILQSMFANLAFYEGEGEGEGGGDGGTGGAGGEGEGKGGKGGEAKFTQEHVNSLLAKEKKSWQEKLTKSEAALQTALKSKGLTEKQREELQSQLDDVQKSMRTKEEQLEHERTEAARKHKEATDQLTADRDAWKNRYTKSSIERAILDGANEHDAYDPEQVVALIGPHTELAEEVGEDGKKTGRLVPKTTLELPGKDGKLEKVSGSPAEVIERMAKVPKKFGNLFKNQSTGGLGTPPNAGQGSGSTDLAELASNPAAYRKARKEGTLPVTTGKR